MHVHQTVQGSLHHIMVYEPRRQDSYYYRRLYRANIALGINTWVEPLTHGQPFMLSVEFLRNHRKVAPLPPIDSWSPRNKRRAIKQP